jgi:formimidoylglutamate deiminase
MTFETKTYLARAAWCEPDNATAGGRSRWVEHAYVRVDAQGIIVEVGTCAAKSAVKREFGVVHDLGQVALLPGMVNGHSHAFQRLIRGKTGRRAAGDPSSFWSWRSAMYEAASLLNPDLIYDATLACYSEMAQAGISAVGEFHYVHHQPDGTPYDDENAMSKAIAAAAADVGIRLTLLEVFYARAGFGQTLLPEQRRFCDASLDRYLRRVDDLRTWANHRTCRIGLAPHSIRAVGAADLRVLSHYANKHELVVHAHVSEQVRENDECAREHQCTPIELFDRCGLLERSRSFTAVHAIHVTARDMALLHEQHVCACPTTEADLGDGIVPAQRWLASGVRMALGSDSNAVIDLVQEARFLEMNERLAARSRLVLANASGEVAPTLIEAASEAGSSSLGLDGVGRLAKGMAFDAAAFDLDHPSLRDVEPAFALDAIVLAGSAAPCIQTWVAGRPLATGRHQLRRSWAKEELAGEAT